MLLLLFSVCTVPSGLGQSCQFRSEDKEHYWVPGFFNVSFGHRSEQNRPRVLPAFVEGKQTQIKGNPFGRLQRSIMRGCRETSDQSPGGRRKPVCGVMK